MLRSHSALCVGGFFDRPVFMLARGHMTESVTRVTPEYNDEVPESHDHMADADDKAADLGAAA